MATVGVKGLTNYKEQLLHLTLHSGHP